jgi:hypothetical protein
MPIGLRMPRVYDRSRRVSLRESGRVSMLEQSVIGLTLNFVMGDANPNEMWICQHHSNIYFIVK